MRLWRLVRPGHEGFDGTAAVRHGSRYASPGRPLVHFASEAGLAVLIALRYLQDSPAALHEPYRLGWTTAPEIPDLAPTGGDEAALRRHVDRWLDESPSLLLALPSAVLPEAQIILMNPRHPHAVRLSPLQARPFTFGECLHRPPMLDRYRLAADGPGGELAGEGAGAAPASDGREPAA